MFYSHLSTLIRYGLGKTMRKDLKQGLAAIAIFIGIFVSVQALTGGEVQPALLQEGLELIIDGLEAFNDSMASQGG